MKVAIIPARGGSKRIPRKNIKNFSGRPMIAYSISAAQDCGLFDRIIVSTDDEEIADIDQEILGEGKGDRGCQMRVSRRLRHHRKSHHEEHGDAGDEELDAEARLAGKALVGLLGDLKIVVIKTDRAESERHEQRGDHVDVGKIGPEQRSADDAGENHQPAHGRRTGLLEVGLRSVGADRLTLALTDSE